LKNIKDCLTEIDAIAEKYSVDLSNVEKGKKMKVERPTLIISESFE
jgi:hypothetical protein